MSPSPSFDVISLSAAAISSAWARLSSAHGPAISARGNALPRRMLPIVTIGLGAGSTLTVTEVPCRRTMAGEGHRVNGRSALLEDQRRAHRDGWRDHDAAH